jgi:hypothetical protein
VKSDLRLPVLELLPDGSYRLVLMNPMVTDKAGGRPRREDLDPDKAWRALVLYARSTD